MPAVAITAATAEASTPVLLASECGYVASSILLHTLGRVRALVTAGEDVHKCSTWRCIWYLNDQAKQTCNTRQQNPSLPLLVCCYYTSTEGCLSAVHAAFLLPTRFTSSIYLDVARHLKDLLSAVDALLLPAAAQSKSQTSEILHSPVVGL